jgi:small subunit ribosomal protein S9
MAKKKPDEEAIPEAAGAGDTGEDVSAEAESPQKEAQQAEEAQAEQPQAEGAPAEQAQAQETHAEEPPAEQAQVEQPQAEEAPAEQVQPQETHAEEPTADQAPAEEPQAGTPAEEPQAESPEAQEAQVVEPAEATSEVPDEAEAAPADAAPAGEPGADVGNREAQPEPPPALIELAADARYSATGKRKSSIARVILQPGTGAFLLNGKPLDGYFPRKTLQEVVRQPLKATGYLDRVDIRARIHGGGISSQADAVRHGIAKALIEADPNLRGELKRRQLLTRDPRVKERRKAGLKKARKRPQFSKR